MKPDYKSLMNMVEGISGRHRPRKVFTDFVELAAIRISNSFDPVHFHMRRQRAQEVLKNYNNAEQVKMGDLLGALAELMPRLTRINRLEDVLGRLFEELRLGQTGQDLTPDSVADLLSRLCIKRGIAEKGYTILHESSAGSGVLILAAAMQVLEYGYNYCSQFVAFAVEKDIRCVHMAYFQLSMYGIPAVIVHGDTLALSEYSRWYTPMYLSGDWVWREPWSLYGKRNPDDERLKMMSEPLYEAIRRMQMAEAQAQKKED